jgi:N-acetylmuramoyl-L-alanine amidase
MRRRRLVLIAVMSTAFASVLPAAGALGFDLDNPNLFGPGERWERPSNLEQGDSGPWVIRLQQGLTAAGFRPGDVNGVFGPETLGAVYAFQKVHGLERDGVFGEDDWQVLEIGEPLDLPFVADQPDRVEVDLDAQVLYLVVDHQVEVVLPISSGNGELYRGRAGSLVRANTPEGSFTFQRHINGWRISYLGGLYRPYYFRGGYAIHGSYKVPPYPDSHGCVRVELHDMDYLTTQLRLGMPIHVYGLNVERAELFDI